MGLIKLSPIFLSIKATSRLRLIASCFNEHAFLFYSFSRIRWRVFFVLRYMAVSVWLTPGSFEFWRWNHRHLYHLQGSKAPDISWKIPQFLFQTAIEGVDTIIIICFIGQDDRLFLVLGSVIGHTIFSVIERKNSGGNSLIREMPTAVSLMWKHPV